MVGFNHAGLVSWLAGRRASPPSRAGWPSGILAGALRIQSRGRLRLWAPLWVVPYRIPISSPAAWRPVGEPCPLLMAGRPVSGQVPIAAGNARGLSDPDFVQDRADPPDLAREGRVPGDLCANPARRGWRLLTRVATPHIRASLAGRVSMPFRIKSHNRAVKILAKFATILWNSTAALPEERGRLRFWCVASGAVRRFEFETGRTG